MNNACTAGCDLRQYPQGSGRCTCGAMEVRMRGAPDPIEVDARAWLRTGADIIVTDRGVEVFRSQSLEGAMLFANERRAVKAKET